MKRSRLSQPRLQGERRVPSLSCLHPILAAMVQMEADISNVHVGWIINDAVAAHFGQPDLTSTAIYARTKQGR